MGVVRELYGVMAARGAAGGFVVTSGHFTDEAIRFASGLNVTLIDGPELQALIRDARASPNVGAVPVPPSAQPGAPSGMPDCPLCAGPMVRRTARRGARAGDEFWGCTNFPSCHGTRAMT